MHLFQKKSFCFPPPKKSRATEGVLLRLWLRLKVSLFQTKSPGDNSYLEGTAGQKFTPPCFSLKTYTYCATLEKEKKRKIVSAASDWRRNQWIDSDAWEGRNLSCPIPTYLHSHETPTNKCNLSVFVVSGVWGRTAAARDSALVLFKAISWEMFFATNKIK